MAVDEQKQLPRQQATSGRAARPAPPFPPSPIAARHSEGQDRPALPMPVRRTHLGRLRPPHCDPLGTNSSKKRLRYRSVARHSRAIHPERPVDRCARWRRADSRKPASTRASYCRSWVWKTRASHNRTAIETQNIATPATTIKSGSIVRSFVRWCMPINYLILLIYWRKGCLVNSVDFQDLFQPTSSLSTDQTTGVHQGRRLRTHASVGTALVARMV